MSHTPGPWRSFEAGSEGCYIKRNTGNAKEDMQTLALVGHREALENRANARLIAAAPDLLKALREVVDERWSELDMMRCNYARGTSESVAWHEGVKEMWRMLDLIKRPAIEAIAKATGGAQ